jgi:transcriptional regulator with XRE-family HTH domain
MEQKKDLGKKIKKAALDADLSLKDLGVKLNVSRQMISQWTSGNRNPKTCTLRKIAKATGKPLNFFVDNSENMITNAGDNAIIGKNQTVINSLGIELLKKDIELQKKENEVLREKISKIELLLKDKKQ